MSAIVGTVKALVASEVPEFLKAAPKPPPGIDATLAERGKNYGPFIENARIAQDLKDALHKSPKWATLQPDMKEGLELIASKIGRMLSGDPNYVDSWHDIAGYALLIEKRLTTKETV